MSVFQNRPALRWLVPVAASVVVVGGGAAIGTLGAAADPALPPRSAAQLLVDLQTAQVDGFSGTVVQRADLGLPALPGIGGSGSADLVALASGTHTLRVWYAGPDRTRVALLGTLGESDVMRNGSDVWTWRSQSNEATHYRLPEGGAEHPHGPNGSGPNGSGPNGLPATPQEAADQALAAIDPSTRVTVGRSATIAGRDAYELVLHPRDAASLVDQVRIAIDAEEHVPLRFELFAKGSDEPAFELAFTQVDFDTPGDNQFTFNPPPGTKVTEGSGEPRRHRPEGGEAPDGLSTAGQGWTTVLVGRIPGGQAPALTGKDLPAGTAGTPNGADLLGNLLDAFPRVQGDWGSGRLFTTKLVNVLLLDDGRVLVGAVTPQRLYEVAGTAR
ncbi:outer membrane lipoprotein carrier protein LolA [Micromonospora sp. NPDC050397]|uniref:LolA family protein n=1 Tax=Micromonospora sp. NPDC050397 TaxID=3364279 RepID=UPI003850C52B